MLPSGAEVASLSLISYTRNATRELKMRKKGELPSIRDLGQMVRTLASFFMNQIERERERGVDFKSHGSNQR